MAFLVSSSLVASSAPVLVIRRVYDEYHEVKQRQMKQGRKLRRSSLHTNVILLPEGIGFGSFQLKEETSMSNDYVEQQ